jgi:hypothetical protein
LLKFSIPKAILLSKMINTLRQQSATRIGIRQLELRQQLWPHYGDTDLWLRTVRNGFTTVPRTMPLIFQIMDYLSKGKPVSAAFFDLWCRAYDECFVVLNRQKEMAFNSGFTGQRAEQTWLGRITTLHDLGFINTQPGPSGPMSYAIILNPYKVIKAHYEKQAIPADLYNALLVRANEIGATDLTEPEVNNAPPPRKSRLAPTTPEAPRGMLAKKLVGK